MVAAVGKCQQRAGNGAYAGLKCSGETAALKVSERLLSG